jgi:hypothetical protein
MLPRDIRARSVSPGQSGVLFPSGCEILLLFRKPDRLWFTFDGQWAYLYRDKEADGVRLATNFHLVQRLRASEAIPLFPHTPSWCGKDKVTSACH